MLLLYLWMLLLALLLLLLTFRLISVLCQGHYTGFPNSGKWWGVVNPPPPPVGIRNFSGRNFFTWCGENLRKSEEWFSRYELLSKQKQHSMNTEHQLKSKLAWLVCQEIKTKMVQEQWLKLKMTFLLIYSYNKYSYKLIYR